MDAADIDSVALAATLHSRGPHHVRPLPPRCRGPRARRRDSAGQGRRDPEGRPPVLARPAVVALPGRPDPARARRAGALARRGRSRPGHRRCRRIRRALARPPRLPAPPPHHRRSAAAAVGVGRCGAARGACRSPGRIAAGHDQRQRGRLPDRCRSRRRGGGRRQRLREGHRRGGPPRRALDRAVGRRPRLRPRPALPERPRPARSATGRDRGGHQRVPARHAAPGAPLPAAQPHPERALPRRGGGAGHRAQRLAHHRPPRHGAGAGGDGRARGCPDGRQLGRPRPAP